MTNPDWIVLIISLVFIITYGVVRGRSAKSLDGYFLSNRSMPWYLVLLSIMGTQASAITFLAAPGQAYTDGMRFLQYYFGLPLAAVVIAISFIPVFNKLKVYTAYEYLENRFDVKTRTFTSLLFLLQRGLSTGISIFAPSIILSVLLGWNIYLTNLCMGGLVIIYTVSGGAKAVAYTQQFQFVIIMLGMGLAAYYVVQDLPHGLTMRDALHVSGRLGKMNIITTGMENGRFNWGDKYNIFSGMIGGLFLALSYFGTDQSQVGRYLTARNIKQSRMGMLMNGIVKVPMQFFILIIGVFMFAFYQFNSAPAFFNEAELTKLKQSEYNAPYQRLITSLDSLQTKRTEILEQYATTKHEQILNDLKPVQQKTDAIRNDIKTLVKKNNGNDNDTNYIFLKFVLDYLPRGVVGLIIAVVFLASWSSVAAALNSLSSSSVVDIHRRFFIKNGDDKQDYKISRLYTLFWGIFCVAVAMFVSNWGNSLIEVVNVLGSLFYGTILGIFLVALYIRQVRGGAVFFAAIVAELIVIILFLLNDKGIIPLGFLWLNAIGALLVIGLGILFQWLSGLIER